MAVKKIIELVLPLGHSQEELLSKLADKLSISYEDIPQWTVIRKSIDARRKDAIKINYAIQTGVLPQCKGIAGLLPDNYRKNSSHKLLRDINRPVIAGFGPSGIFAALYLALCGYNPIVLERGSPVEKRSIDVASFWKEGLLDLQSNVQFGEGGAGTFSDGKLTTRIKDSRCESILQELVLCGAPGEILYLSKPHIGTDILRKVVVNLREKIISLGGEIRFNCTLDGFDLNKGCLEGVFFTDNSDSAAGSKQVYLKTKRLILAIGHSARDTFEIVYKSGLPMQAKAFAMGVRIEHPQNLINAAQYGVSSSHPQLPAAEYRLATKLSSGRSVYSFCMCPGGEVILASSEAGGIVTNGMSYHARNMNNANSALLVSISEADFIGQSPLGGIELQRRLEQRAYVVSGGYNAPSQLLSDFMPEGIAAKTDKVSRQLMLNNLPFKTESTIKPVSNFCASEDYLPSYICKSLQEGIEQFDRKIKGFAWEGAVITGPETRSSSPVRILRNDNMQSEKTGIFPCGEGAGYAGGIMSAALDGLKCASAIAMI